MCVGGTIITALYDGNANMDELIEHLTGVVRGLYPHVGVIRKSAPVSQSLGFSDAIIYRLETDQGVWALRGWPIGTDPSRVRSLHALLKYLVYSGLEVVCAPLEYPRAETLFLHRSRWWQLEPWMTGQPEPSPSPTQIEAGAAVLARWHGMARRWGHQHPRLCNLLGSSEQIPTGPATRLRRLQEWREFRVMDYLNKARKLWRYDPSGADLITILERLTNRLVYSYDMVISRLLAVSSEPLPNQPVLRDIWYAHLLYTGDVISGLIDPCLTGLGTVVTDLARWCSSLHGSLSQNAHSILEAYRRLARLTPSEERAYLPLVGASIWLSGATWLAWCGGERPWVTIRSQMLEQISHWCDQLEQLPALTKLWM